MVFGAITAAQAHPAAPSPAGGQAAAHHGHVVKLSSAQDRLSESVKTKARVGAAKPKAAGTHRAVASPAATTGTSGARSRTAAIKKPAAPAKPAALTCSGTAQDPAYLPLNYAAIVTFLTAHGYTDMAAVGIAGNIWQESRGNPESVGTGGGGLIGWTPLPGGFVTGNPSADLQTQLAALLTYNQQWAQYIPALNAAANPTAAADVYMNYFERPGIPAAYNRETAANAVAQACGI
jgi:hypothetical protein